MGDSTEEWSKVGTVELNIYGSGNITTMTSRGQSVVDTAKAYALPKTDIQYDDRISYNSGMYEVTGITPQPNDGDVTILECSLKRVDY